MNNFNLSRLNIDFIVSDPEDDEISYIVTIESTKSEIFLIISDSNIKEKDFLTGR